MSARLLCARPQVGDEARLVEQGGGTRGEARTLAWEVAAEPVLEVLGDQRLLSLRGRGKVTPELFKEGA